MREPSTAPNAGIANDGHGKAPPLGRGFRGYDGRWRVGDDVFFLSFTVLSRWPGCWVGSVSQVRQGRVVDHRRERPCLPDGLGGAFADDTATRWGIG